MTFSKKKPLYSTPLHSTELFKIFFSLLTPSTAFLQKASGPGKNLLDYSILYLKTDICHLSDVFQKFSNFAYKTYEIDPRHSYTLPGFSWQRMLKMTKIELELFQILICICF